ncbi:NADP-dependent isocitrate dehydrogenase [Salinarimonas sp.]|uniref:NADP-dependent isocitrate dehydrogenase n=1 Tax=Salinarimonas sp. TaxID=2766526 RepID=UPI00391A5759
MNTRAAPQTFDPAATTHATPVTVAYGDGIGPEIMSASLRILKAAGAAIAIEPIEIGEAVYKAGHASGIPPEAWETIRRNKVLFKAPITTPQGGGYKSLNVTMRKALGLFANVRPCTAYAPFVPTLHPAMDVVVVRENEEDLYAGIEHRQTDDVVQCLKLITRPGCERIARYAFEYARANGRKKVTCFTKDNIMKLTDGLFRRVFEEVAAEYPEIATEHMIIDIGAARLAASPQHFDVILTGNLYGDIVSDIAAEIAGSVGLAPSANIGPHGAMFEAIHGSAPDIAGRDVANPSGLLLAGVMMLVHIGQGAVAARIHNAWKRTIEDGILTADLARGASAREGVAAVVGTRAFADAVIARLGEMPRTLAPVAYADAAPLPVPEAAPRVPARKELVGVDVFVHAADIAPDALAERLAACAEGLFDLTMITSRGVKVWPQGLPETALVDHWRARFKSKPGLALNKAMIARLLGRMAEAGIDFVKTEQLYLFDGKPGFALGQGE